MKCDVILEIALSTAAVGLTVPRGILGFTGEMWKKAFVLLCRRGPWECITADVIEATVQCMLAEAQEAENHGDSPAEVEATILGEFGRCLNQIIDHSRKMRDTPPLSSSWDLLFVQPQTRMIFGGSDRNLQYGVCSCWMCRWCPWEVMSCVYCAQCLLISCCLQ